MVINAGPEFEKAKEKYQNARSNEEKLEALKEMLRTAPKHKGSENLLSDIRAKIGRLKNEMLLEKKKKAARYSISIPKEGFQIAIIGFPNSGKSTLLNYLTNANAEVAEYPFTTKEPVVGSMFYEGGRIQIFELPALMEGAATKQRHLLSLLTSCDGIILIYSDDYEKEVLLKELNEFGIQKKILFLRKGERLEKQQIFEFFELIRVYTKEPGEDPDLTQPILLKKGSSVLDAAEEIHKDFAEKLEYARLWGSAKFPGQRVEKDYILQDGDIVEFHISD
ncbi:MAG: GTPase [archaeon]